MIFKGVLRGALFSRCEIFKKIILALLGGERNFKNFEIYKWRPIKMKNSKQ